MEFYKMRNRYTSPNKVLKTKNLHSAPDRQPPAANRGVQKPEEAPVQTIQFDELCRVDYNGMLASIDYLEFTVFDLDYIFVIQNILELPLTDFFDTGRGGGGYPNKSQASWGDVRVLHGAKNPEVMGVHVTVPGDGCRALFSHVMPSKLISNILNYNCKVTRIDLALDNIGDVYFYPHELKDFHDAGVMKSRWRSFESIQKSSMQSTDLTGDTVYLGSRTSDLFCRVYDKTLERIYRGDDRELPEHWVRWELVCKDDRAQVACEQLLESGFAIGEIISGVFSNYLSILVKNPFDSHKERWPIHKRWQCFIGDVKPIRLFRVLKPEKTLEDVADWIIKQCAPSLSALIRVYGEDWIQKEIGLNAWRMNKHLAAITIQAAQQLEQERKGRASHFI